MPNYRRHHREGGSYFLTINLQNRQQSLLTDQITILRAATRKVRAAHPFHIEACVVLPDHLHCVWTLPPGDADYSARVRLLKSAFSKALPAAANPTASQARRHEKGFWQRRFWEHTIRDQADFNAHIDYVHINPLKHGLVARVRDWPYSTFHRYVEAGILTPEWGGDVVLNEGIGGE